MLEQIILGTIQGIAEWLPVSSEGLLVLAEANFFGGTDLTESIKTALFLHLGTFLAALVYFRSEVIVLFKTAYNYSFADEANKKLLKFLLVSTVISGVLGYALLRFAGSFSTGSKTITVMVGLLLLFTGALQIRIRSGGGRRESDLNWADSWILGVLQGLAALPGLSRSGLTVSGLLLRDIGEERALKISFLMSLPIVLGGNIALNFSRFALSAEQLVGLLFSFVFGLLTIHLLLKLARRINFGYFVLFFAILVLASAIV